MTSHDPASTSVELPPARNGQNQPNWSILKHSLEKQLLVLSRLPNATAATRRTTATELLDTLASLMAMSTLNDSSENLKLPVVNQFLRRGLRSFVEHMGHGDPQLRTFLLQHLKTTATTNDETRQILLDVLPLSMPVTLSHPAIYSSQDHHVALTSSHSSLSSHQTKCHSAELETATNQVLQVLQEIIQHEPSALLPVLGCLSSMPFLSDTGKTKSFQLALSSLQIVHEADLPALVSALLQHADSPSKIKQALQAIRTELQLMEQQQNLVKNNNDKSSQQDDPMTMVIHVLLNRLVRDVVSKENYHDSKSHRSTSGMPRTKSKRKDSSSPQHDKYTSIATVYFEILKECMIQQSTKETSVSRQDNQELDDDKDDDHEDYDDGTIQNFLLLDVAVLLSLYQHVSFCAELEPILDQWVAHNSFPFDTLLQLSELVCHQRRPTSIIYRRLVQPMITFGVYLLLAPVRIAKSLNNNESSKTEKKGNKCLIDINLSNLLDNLKKVMQLCQDYIVQLHHQVDRESQSEIVQCLLQLSEESASTKWNVGSTESSIARLLINPIMRREALLPTNKYACDGYSWCQVFVDDAVNTALQTLAKQNKRCFCNSKHILIERLTNTPFPSPQWERHCMQHLCGILSALFESTTAVSGSGAGLQASEIMIILQKLLFTSSYSVFRAPITTVAATDYAPGADLQRVVRGLLLATELVKSPFLSAGDWDCIKQWVLRILLPSTRRMVEPEIGSPGLHFLEALMAIRGRGEQEVDPAFLRKEAFQHMKMVLANTGLIQLLSQYRHQVQRAKKKDAPPVLAYNNAPSDLFMTESSKNRKTRVMVFCLAFFLGDSELYMPSRWDQTVNWVFHLVDTYLRVGREISLATSTPDSHTDNSGKRVSINDKWLPNGWLQAAIEFPSFVLPHDIETASKKQKAAHEWLTRLLLVEEDVCAASPSEAREIQNGLVDLFASFGDINQFRPVIVSVLNVGLSLLSGISLSFAVVKNSFAHFRGFCKDEDEYRVEVLRLIQFQMTRIYDMKKKIKALCYILLAAHTCAGRLKRSYAKKQVGPYSNQDDTTLSPSRAGSKALDDIHVNPHSDHPEMAKFLLEQLGYSLNRMKHIQLHLFSSHNFISAATLLECVVDLMQDNLIKTHISSLASSQSPDLIFRSHFIVGLLEMRQDLLDHLITLLFGGPGSNKQTKLELSEVHFAKLLEMGIYLAEVSPRLRKVCHKLRDSEEEARQVYANVTDSTLMLSTRYLRMIYLVLASVSKDGGCEDSERMKNLYIFVCSKVFREISVTEENENSGRSDKQVAFTGFLSMSLESEDLSISLHLMNILTILAGCDGRHFQDQVFDASWRVLQTVYCHAKDATLLSEFPYAFVLAVTKSTTATAGCQSDTKHVEKCFRDTVLRKYGKNQRHFLLRHHIFRHWGLLVLFPCLQDRGIEHFKSIHEELALLLASHDEPDSGEAKKQSGGRELRSRKRNGGLCVQQSDARVFVSKIPELNEASLPVLFETLLHCTVATMCTMSVDGGHGLSLPKSRMKGSKETGPYHRFETHQGLFSSLLDLFKKWHHVFPRQTLPIIFVSSKHMIDGSMRQLQACVEWRVAQPPLSVAEKKAAKYDPGAIRYLEQFLQSCWHYTVTAILSFCDFACALEQTIDKPGGSKREKRSSGRNAHESESDYEENSEAEDEQSLRAATTKSRGRYRAKANALRFAVEKAAIFIEGVASSHNLRTPALVQDKEGKENIFPSKRKSDLVVDKAIGFKRKATASHFEKDSGNKSIKKKRRLSLRDDASVAGSSESSAHNPELEQRMHQEEEDSDSLLECDDHSRNNDEDDNSSGSFGVTGKWGEEDAHTDVSSDSSVALELENEVSLF